MTRWVMLVLSMLLVGMMCLAPAVVGEAEETEETEVDSPLSSEDSDDEVDVDSEDDKVDLEDEEEEDEEAADDDSEEDEDEEEEEDEEGALAEQEQEVAGLLDLADEIDDSAVADQEQDEQTAQMRKEVAEAVRDTADAAAAAKLAKKKAAGQTVDLSARSLHRATMVWGIIGPNGCPEKSTKLTLIASWYTKALRGKKSCGQLKGGLRKACVQMEGAFSRAKLLFGKCLFHCDNVKLKDGEEVAEAETEGKARMCAWFK